MREETRELGLYIENTGFMYQTYTKPEIIRLAKKYKAGVFDKEKALLTFKRIADLGAKRYAKEFANPQQWNIIFSPDCRKETAQYLLDTYMENINGENPID